MNLYHVWFDVKPGIGDLEIAEKLKLFLGHMQSEGRIENWRLTRCKLGLAPPEMPEFHVMIETEDLAQLDTAFKSAASRSGETDELHFAANQLVTNVRFALYRDFPDAERSEPNT